MSETVATEAVNMRECSMHYEKVNTTNIAPEHSYRSAVAKRDGRWTAAIYNKSESVIVYHINSFH